MLSVIFPHRREHHTLIWSALDSKGRSCKIWFEHGHFRSLCKSILSKDPRRLRIFFSQTLSCIIVPLDYDVFPVVWSWSLKQFRDRDNSVAHFFFTLLSCVYRLYKALKPFIYSSSNLNNKRGHADITAWVGTVTSYLTQLAAVDTYKENTHFIKDTEAKSAHLREVSSTIY